MKKILAGVLAAASMLAVSASAFAASDEKTVTKAGDVSYDVGIAAPKITLNLVMPAKMTAALNPYGADIKLDAEETPTTTTAGIASVAYAVTNKSTDYGVYIDATALTTVTTTDKTKWTVKGTSVTDGTKGAALVLTAGANVAAIKTASTTLPTANAAATASTQGSLIMDSTAAADSSKGLAAGQVQQKKMIYLKAAADAENPVTTYMAFVGKLAASTSTAEVTWNEDDAINVNLVLKVSAGPKSLT